MPSFASPLTPVITRPPSHWRQRQAWEAIHLLIIHHLMSTDSTVSVLQDARNVGISGGTVHAGLRDMTIPRQAHTERIITRTMVSGGTINAGPGDMTIPRSGPNITNHGSYRGCLIVSHTTRNVHADVVYNFGRAQNVNTGANHGAINQDDNRGADSGNRDSNAERDYDYQQSGGQGSRPAYFYPPLPLPHADPLGMLPPGSAQYQSAHYGPPPQGYHRYPPGIPPMDARDVKGLRAAMQEQRGEGWDSGQREISVALECTWRASVQQHQSACMGKNKLGIGVHMACKG